ncbi:MAG: MFS transporter [Anaerolineae bacterium]|jgi:MFS family permease|nr:MFS transporter [Anaerolineae bacterium]
MNIATQQAIKQDRQITKFGWYGLLKNLKFFEPYLLIFLLANGITFTQIGILMAMREVIIYVFEIPSGVIADQFGKKKEMLLCFTFYIISFIFFFLQGGFGLYLVAMIFFGLGDAFRTGTHKAMIMQYLQEKEWGDYKSFVYGRTRSFSLIGSAVSSILSVLMVIFLPGLRWVFLLVILPYIADFILIASYPNSLDRLEGEPTRHSFSSFFNATWQTLKTSFAQPKLRTLIFNSSTFQGVIKSIKDYVQPLLVTTLMVGFVISDETIVKVIIGIFYFFMNLINSAASRNAYRFSERFSERTAINATFIIMAAAVLLTGGAAWTNWSLLIMLFFILINVSSNIRRPLLVGALSDIIEPNQRASVLSVESQMTSVFTALGAFLMGFSVDRVGLVWSFLGLGVILLALQVILWIRPSVKDA